MNTRMGIVTLAVEDLGRALDFYGDVLGLVAPEVEEGADHVAIELRGGIYLVLYPAAAFAPLAGQAHVGREASSCLGWMLDTREEVDALLARGAARGGVVTHGPTAEEWGYSAYLKDPDGHLWEILHNPDFFGEAGDGA